MNEQHIKPCPICGRRLKRVYKPELQYHCRGKCGLILRLQNSDFEKLLSSFVEHLPSSPWIRVDDRLPTNMRDVWVYPNDKTDIAFCDGGGWKYEEYNYTGSPFYCKVLTRITHWAETGSYPLPPGEE